MNNNLFVAGIGPGNKNLISLEALNIAKSSDIILVPRSNINHSGIAEEIIKNYLPQKKLLPVYFPMIKSQKKRSLIILEQLKNFYQDLLNSEKIFFPVIGDSSLFSTGKYLINEIKKLMPDIIINLIPGISAYSLAACEAQKFMAMNDEIFTLISGTANPEKIKKALSSSDSIAIYKPRAINNLKDLINPDEFEIIRVDLTGFEGQEKIIKGIDALENIQEYLSVILLWRI